jgi:hypothetical protein
MSRKIMLSFFDHSTVMAQPWAAAGYLCYCIDAQHPRGETPDENNENIVRVGADILDWLPPREGDVVFAAFFPPCTDVAVSGSRWMRDKGVGKLHRAIGLFHRSMHLAELLKAPYLIENPVSTISSYWRKPDHVFDPCDYGDPYTKKTCLWTGGGFVMPKKKRVKPTEGSKMHMIPPGPDRANLRSVTPAGFARKVFQANDPAKGKSVVRSGWKKKCVEKYWHGECAVTGVRVSAILQTAHIRPASMGGETDALANSLLLAPHIHALFDQGLLTFKDSGQIVFSHHLTLRDRQLMALPKQLRRPPTEPEMEFIRYHRENVFRGA